jgi:hypothetical protein
MKKVLMRIIAISLFLFVNPFFTLNSVNAASPSIYESVAGIDGNNINSSGSVSSVGFTGNWNVVNSYKNPNSSTGLASIYVNTYNSYLKFPSNSYYALPANNTAGGSGNAWNLHYSARQMSTGVNFDSNGTFYLSFLGYCPVISGSWGSYVVGLLSGLPTSSSDTSKKSIYVGRSYSGAPTVQVTTANMAAWNPATYSAVGTTNNPAAPDGNSWFIIAKFTTASSGNDTVQVKFYSSADTVPATDSGISWDVSYSTPLTGAYNYLGIQTEYNAMIDELRGGGTFDAVSGVSIPATIGAPSILTIPYKGVPLNVTVSVNATGYVRFSANGKRIAGCLKVVTTGSSPSFTATCNWKPTVKGSQKISAEFVSTDSSYRGAKSPETRITVVQRVNTR